jgi:cyd operon protein YbgT
MYAKPTACIKTEGSLTGTNGMWYFSWILGVGLACSFGILNAMWYELRTGAAAVEDPEEKA